MSNDYSGWDLKTLKTEIESSDLSWLESSAHQFDQGTRACTQAADDFMAQVRSLGAAWEGAAASAAVNDAQTTHQSITQMHSASTASSSASKSYYERAKADQAQSRSIPNVDDSWGHAITSGAPGGIVGVGVAKYEQHQKYTKAHAQAVQIANRMDSDGTSQANTMRAQSWPDGPTTSRTPPSSLPPVPGSGGRSGSIGGNYNASPHGGGPGSGYSPPVSGVVMNPGDGEIMNHGVKGHNGGKPPQQETTTPPPTTQPNIPSTTTPQGDPGTDPLTPAGPPSQAVPETPSVTGGAGTAAGVLGGAGLLGAGALSGTSLLGGRGGLAGTTEGFAEGEGTGRGRLGALGEEGGPGARAGSGLAEGEGSSTGRGRLGALGDEAGLRPGGGRIAGGGAAEEELPPGRRGLLRTGAPEGFMGEPVAGEAGRLGGYPGGGGARRRNDDDEEAPVPDYLVETEDVWGDGVIAAPPVIGE